MVYTTPNQDARTPTFPAGLDVHWETDSWEMWNEQERVAEKQELVYEVSWIRETRCLAALSEVEAESAKLKDARGAIVMSTALVTLEPRLLDFRPEIDRGARSSPGCRPSLPGRDSADKLTGNILSSILSDP